MLFDFITICSVVTKIYINYKSKCAFFIIVPCQMKVWDALVYDIVLLKWWKTIKRYSVCEAWS